MPIRLRGVLTFLTVLAILWCVPTAVPGGEDSSPPTVYSQGSERLSPLQDFGFGVGYMAPVPSVAEAYAKIGIRWAKSGEVGWRHLEPSPPDADGNHDYRWESLDQLIGVWQEAGVLHLQVWLKCNARWATSEPSLPPGLSPELIEVARKSRHIETISTPPKEDRWEDYAALVANVVERYDGDGDNDMPGLRHPVMYYEIESEAQQPGQWQGSLEDYLKLLETAHRAAKSANPNARIILSGFTFADLMDDIPSAETFAARMEENPVFRDHFQFNQTLLAHPELFDDVEFHYLTDYRAIYATVDWIRTEMRRNG
jgi:hypothetical protein